MKVDHPGKDFVEIEIVVCHRSFVRGECMTNGVAGMESVIVGDHWVDVRLGSASASARGDDIESFGLSDPYRVSSSDACHHVFCCDVCLHLFA